MNTVKGFVHIRFSFAMYIMGFSWPSQKHRKSKVYNNSSKTFFICFFWAKYLILLSIRTAPLVVNHEESLKQHLIKKQQRKKILHKKQKGKQPSQNQSQQRMTARQKWRLQRKTIKTPSRTIKKYNHEKVKEMLQSNKRQRKQKKTIIQGWFFYWSALKVSDYM